MATISTDIIDSALVVIKHHHLCQEIVTDGDGFVRVLCGCESLTPPCPDYDIAVDAHIEHVLGMLAFVLSQAAT